MKIIAWNVNGLRSLINSDSISLADYLKINKPDIFCMSETKLSCPDAAIKTLLEKLISGYKYRYYSTCIARKGYSGTSIWSNKKPLDIIYGIGIKEHDNEGRVITLEYDKFYLTHVYTPNSGQILQRLDYRVNKWDKDFRKFIEDRQKNKPVIVCGDLNCAHKEIDIHSPETNRKSAGFTDEERDSFSLFLKNNKLIDSFRYLHPNEVKQFSYWSYRGQARKNNKGWRIDYFLVDTKLKDNIKKSLIQKDQMGSDHAPVFLEIDI